MTPVSKALRRRGFTLIEIIVVIAIISILAALLIPAIQSMRVSSARTQSINNLKQLGAAAQNFHATFKYLPYNGTGAIARFNDQNSQTWAFQLLPYLEQTALYELANGAPPPSDAQVRVAVFNCPGRGRPGYNSEGLPNVLGPTTDYGLNPHLNDESGGLQAKNNRCTLATITDGTSCTILFGQQYIRTDDYAATGPDSTGNPAELGSIWISGTKSTARDINYFYPDSRNYKYAGNGQWGGPFAGGALFCFADGSVRLISYSMAAEDGTASLALIRLFTPRDGQTSMPPD